VRPVAKFEFGGIIVGVFGFVAYVMSYGILIPEGLDVLRIISAIGAMAGYVVGQELRNKIEGFWPRVLSALGAGIVSTTSFIWYVIYVEQNYSGAPVVIKLGILIALAFFGLAFLVGTVGVGVSFEAPQTDRNEADREGPSGS